MGSPVKHYSSFSCDSPLLLGRSGLGTGRALLRLCPCYTQWAMLSNQHWGGSGCFQVCFTAWLPVNSGSILHIIVSVVFQACNC